MDPGYAVKLTIGVAAATAALSFGLTFISEALAKTFHAIDQPSGGRKIHQRPIPLWGGLGITIAIFAMMAVYAIPGFDRMQLLGFAVGLLILLVGGLIDDARPLPPHVQIIFPICAAIVVIASRTGIVQVTSLDGGGFSLVWWKVGALSLPADLITFLWLLVATYATKILDGLDGLVSGITVIGAGLVAALSLSMAFYQPYIAVLSAVIGGAYLGFLPKNFNPARQFLGEAGGSIAGFSLGVLAILSSAKIAIALAVLAIPIADVAIVFIGRVIRGVPWYKGDDTHLHFRLLQAGLSQRTAVCLLWGVSLCAGLLALSMQTRGKLFLIGMLMVSTMLASGIAGIMSQRRTKS